MSKILEFLKGKKAYIVGVLTIILGFLNHNMEMVTTGLGIITLRAGITNAVQGVK